MPASRLCLPLLALLLLAPAAPAAGPPRGPIAGWVGDLASNDTARWRRAVERLWQAGRAAEPALRAVMKHRDPDVVLRARLVLGRFDWGIFPDTPPVLVRLIERYRDGNPAQRKAAAEELFKQGRSGYVVLRRLLAREADAEVRRQVTDSLRRHTRPLLRDLLATGNRAGAMELLEAAVASRSDEAMRDLAALWLLTGQTAARARELERRAARGDQDAAACAAYLHRAAGDLGEARRLAGRSGDAELLAGILDEQEDYKELARRVPRLIKESPHRLAVLLHHAGDRAGFDAALARIPATDQATRARVLFFTGRPRQAIEAERKAGSLASACQLLALQGRRREALALSAVDQGKGLDRRVWLLLEQAVVCQQVGEKDRAGTLLRQALQAAEKVPSRADTLLGAVLRAGTRMNRRQEVLGDLGGALDRVKMATFPRSVLAALSQRDGLIMELWWELLRRRSNSALPSAILTRLRGWFEEGKADGDFDQLLAEIQSGKNVPAGERQRWPAVLARTCIVVGKPKKAEEILRTAAQTGKTGAAYRQLADFYFERKRWSEAATEYERAGKAGPADPLALYLRGVALSRAGRAQEGRALIDRARLLPLADESARYDLARGLGQRGLRDEADVEWLLLARTTRFRSIYATNAASSLAARAVRQKQPLEAARWYRRVYMNLGLAGGSFLDGTAYLRVPAIAHLHQARWLLAQGKLDAARAEAKLLLEYLPEEPSVVIDLVRALDRAKRKADADQLFEEVFGGHRRSVTDFPKSALCHNRLAWLAARCGRRLDEALKHARTATTLAPEAPGYLDTLAEVHFQRGDKAEAVAAMKKAVKLAPKDLYFAAQLRRMEAGDRNADVPER
jgi:tetratricopeptide (TPR) repeat protein